MSVKCQERMNKCSCVPTQWMHEQSARFRLLVKYNEKAINIFVAANTNQATNPFLAMDTTVSDLPNQCSNRSNDSIQCLIPELKMDQI